MPYMKSHSLVGRRTRSARARGITAAASALGVGRARRCRTGLRGAGRRRAGAGVSRPSGGRPTRPVRPRSAAIRPGPARCLQEAVSATDGAACRDEPWRPRALIYAPAHGLRAPPRTRPRLPARSDAGRPVDDRQRRSAIGDRHHRQPRARAGRAASPGVPTRSGVDVGELCGIEPLGVDRHRRRRRPPRAAARLRRLQPEVARRRRDGADPRGRASTSSAPPRSSPATPSARAATA